MSTDTSLPPISLHGEERKNVYLILSFFRHITLSHYWLQILHTRISLSPESTTNIDNNKLHNAESPLKELHTVTVSDADQSPRRLRPLLSSATRKLRKCVLIPLRRLSEYFLYLCYPVQVEDLRETNPSSKESYQIFINNINQPETLDGNIR
jgi:hypothetical protein